jgi:hypothetical protein
MGVGGSSGGYRVVPAGVERMAAEYPPQRKHTTTGRAVLPDRPDGVGAARRVEPAPRRQGGAHPTTVRADGDQQEPGRPAGTAGDPRPRGCGRRHDVPAVRAAAAASPVPGGETGTTPAGAEPDSGNS